MIDHIIDKMSELDIDKIFISTNQKFEKSFQKWLESKNGLDATIIAEPSLREEEKPGAVAALAEISPMIQDDCLIIAGDNLFTSSLKPLAKFFNEKQATTIALYDIVDRGLAKQYSTVLLDTNGRITEFLEKPVNPRSTLIGTCIYFMPRNTIPKLREFNSEKGDHDSPGRFIQWLYKREPVYGIPLDGNWWDIGTRDQYDRVNQLFGGMNFGNNQGITSKEVPLRGERLVISRQRST